MDLTELRSLFLFDGLADDQLTELLDAGTEVPFESGTELFHEGEPAEHWWVLVEGRLELVRRAGREEAVVLMAMDRPGVWAGGFRAWNQESSYLATGRGSSVGRMFRVDSADLGRLLRSWDPFSVHLIEGFFQTVRSMDSLSRQRESLIALGRLAGGLAHEINNPAAANARAVQALGDTCDTLLASLTRLAQLSLTPQQFIDLDALRRSLAPAASVTDPLEVADAEEALTTWLDDHDVDESWRIAPALAATGVDTAWCERVLELLGPERLGPGVDWVASTVATAGLVAEIKESTGRISGLVDSVKSYSQVDRASVQRIDVTEGIESTLVMLAHKIGSEVLVERSYGDVPTIEANPGELNQVWTNLIDNAVDAMDGVGTLRISTRVEDDELVVEVGDTGAGMPVEVQQRAFEPFFTTKDVGKGSGLGLDISRRLVADRHHGRIAIESRPGNTTVAVHLPLERPVG